ncbi:MAG: hypothetical protein JO235_12890 [Chroococcidiopsidaceae cyanobacterium CP_BM_RX_35]|nr:hypothetical protein [Chroococcidiopsidaceae cyanobacterium CP_BM_RX_35]
MNATKFTQILTTVLLLGELSAMAAYSQPKPAPTRLETRPNTSTVDLAQVTCQSVLKMSNEDRAYTLIFFHGYISGKNNERLVDTAELTAITGKIADACNAHPETPLMQVFTQFRSTAQK